MVICGRSSAHMLDSLCNHVVAAPCILYDCTLSLSLSLPPSLFLSRCYRNLQPTSARIIDAQRVYEFNYSLITFGFPVFAQPSLLDRLVTRVAFSLSSFSPLLSSFFMSRLFFSRFKCTRISDSYRQINGDLLIEKLTRFLGANMERRWKLSEDNSSAVADENTRTLLLVVDQTRRRAIS